MNLYTFHKFYLLTLIIIGVSLTHVQSFILPELEFLLHVLGDREVCCWDSQILRVLRNNWRLVAILPTRLRIKAHLLNQFGVVFNLSVEVVRGVPVHLDRWALGWILNLFVMVALAFLDTWLPFLALVGSGVSTIFWATLRPTSCPYFLILRVVNVLWVVFGYES